MIRKPGAFWLGFAVLFATSMITASTSEYLDYIHSAETSYAEKRWANAASLYEQAFAAGVGQGGHLYDAACCWSLAGKSSKAFERLSDAVDRGWMNLAWTLEDPDLTALHDDPRWTALGDRLRAVIQEFEAGLDSELRAELATILEEDQRYRQLFDETLRDHGPESTEMESLKLKMHQADARNLERVVKIIDEQGWPGRSVVGPDGSQTAFLVIQHSPLEFQVKYLPLMREAVKTGELAASDLALLEDRVLIGKGKPQIYGSQVRCDPVTWEDCYLLPVEDEANVNQRRAEVGLGPLEHYVSNWNIEWSPPGDSSPVQPASE